MSGSSAWSRSREKMRLFPGLFAQCADEVILAAPSVKVSRHVHSSCQDRTQLILKCRSQEGMPAAVYGKCVAATTTGRQELKRDLCAKEFEALKICFTNAAKKRAK